MAQASSSYNSRNRRLLRYTALLFTLCALPCALTAPVTQSAITAGTSSHNLTIAPDLLHAAPGRRTRPRILHPRNDIRRANDAAHNLISIHARPLRRHLSARFIPPTAHYAYDTGHDGCAVVPLSGEVCPEVVESKRGEMAVSDRVEQAYMSAKGGAAAEEDVPLELRPDAQYRPASAVYGGATGGYHAESTSSAGDEVDDEVEYDRGIPIFTDDAATLVQAELAHVRRRYSNAMSFLQNTPKSGSSPTDNWQVELPPLDQDAGWGNNNGSIPLPHVPKVDTGIPVPVGGSGPPPESINTPLHNRRRLPQNRDGGPARGGQSSRKRGDSDHVKRTPPFEQKSPAIPLDTYIQGNMDVLYYGAIGVGTPVQEMMIDFDTGSADLWVPANCPSCDSKQFQPRHSSTFVNTSQPFAVEYGSGSVSGSLVQDTVTLGNTAVKEHYFGAVEAQSDDFRGNPNSGVMGMAFSSIATSGKKTYFERLIEQASVRVPIFSFHLTRHKPQGSQLCIGCYDSTKYKGSFTWIPVVSKTYWSVSMTGFYATADKVNTLSKTLFAAIDTGTTLIYVTPRVAEQFYAQIPGSSLAKQFGDGFYQYPCAADKNLRLMIGLNNKGLEWNTRDFNLGRTARGSNMCIGGILAVKGGFPEDLAIVGDVFLKSWYSIFDQSQRARIGFASSINNA